MAVAQDGNHMGTNTGGTLSSLLWRKDEEEEQQEEDSVTVAVTGSGGLLVKALHG